MKRLYRSNTDKTLAGIIGGFGEYTGIDPVLLRLLWILIVITTGVLPGIIVYLLGIFIVPKKPL